MYETIGSILLAICGLPEAFKCYREKTCTIGYPMLIMWFIGEICLVIFAFKTKQHILLINYGANVLFVYIMLYYKLKQKDENEVILLDNNDRTMLH